MAEQIKWDILRTVLTIMKVGRESELRGNKTRLVGSGPFSGSYLQALSVLIFTGPLVPFFTGHLSAKFYRPP